MVRINIDVRTDKIFMKAVKSLILQKMNEILGEENNIKEIIDELILKYVDRRQEELIENGLRKQLQQVKMVLPGNCGTSTYYNRVSLNEYIAHAIKKIVNKTIKSKVENLLKNVEVVGLQ